MDTVRQSAKKLSIAGFLTLVGIDLLILQGSGLVLGEILGVDAKYGEFPTIEALLAGVFIPVALSVVLLVVIVSVLGWWPRVLHDEKPPVNRWVWCVPIVLGLTALAMVDYSTLARIDTSMLLILACGSILVGIGEELMFRGVAVNTFRDHGMPEAKVALWSSLLFGAVHVTNIITEGPSAFMQVLVVSISGFFFYLTLRVSGTILVPMALHAMWDFSLFSSSVGPDGDINPMGIIGLLVNVILAIVLLVRRHKIGVSNSEPLAAGP